MLPYFFKNYDRWIDQYVVFDNGSTDGSQDLIASHPRTILRSFQDEDGSHELSAVNVFNLVWKQSRGTADWVVICDIDEHLWHPDMIGYLEDAKRSGCTALRPQAFEMVADCFPGDPDPLWKHVTTGVHHPFFDKLGPFDPEAIQETNFGVGRHVERLTGHVVFDPTPQIKLLHYKQLGAEYVVERHAHLASRLGEQDLNNGWGAHWTWDAKRARANHRMLKSRAKRVISEVED